jgi:hypothetical protein
MYRHGPVCLQGPVSRSRPCWGDAAPAALLAEDGPAEVRWDLVARVRREIAAGTYETPEKWQAALGRLLRRLEED